MAKWIVNSEIEGAIAEAFQSAGLKSAVARSAAQLAAHAVCEQLRGRRIRFTSGLARLYRDRAIYATATIGNSAELAAIESLTPVRIRQIIKNQHIRRHSDKT